MPNELFTISPLSSLLYNLTPFNEKQRLVQYCTDSAGDDLQFNVIINFLGWGNFGPRIQSNETYEMYAVLAPSESAIKIPTFDIGSLYKLLWHEFAHSFANPAIEAYEDEFSALSHLWPAVKESMKSQAYGSWESVIKEQLTESIACRMAVSRFGEDVADLNYVRYQKGRDWMYITPIMTSLKKYEQNREKYPTLKSFMPELLADLKRIKDKDIEAWANEAKKIRTPAANSIPIIDDIYEQDSVLFIVSSQETDLVADRRLKEFIISIRDRLFQNAQIVADTTALDMDLSTYHLSVWGTPAGNLFLQKYLREIPVLIKEDKVVAENEYLGTGYGMLISWVNPLNEKNTMAIYTAQDPQSLVDFNRIMHGAGNYHIFNNFISLKVGEFKKMGGVWLAK
ncbi:uncharacterized protein DUF4932 [Sphingobacterium paludis]|uniref:Uncharacterized protein DUF4932 n=2 Tax=Sphingobacterium paludis TaxID=1476465 RepID=A0A4R7D3S0_9SPHI|nr:uncharacterized protein DUF4932 [Sphingobacterium paludis]